MKSEEGSTRERTTLEVTIKEYCGHNCGNSAWKQLRKFSVGDYNIITVIIRAIKTAIGRGPQGRHKLEYFCGGNRS